MVAWFALFLSLSASLLFGATSAVPVQDLSTELQVNSTADSLQARDLTMSIQIGLLRAVIKDYYWTLYQGPYGIKVNPCPANPKPFKLGSMSGKFDYARNDIDHPPNPPAMELPLAPFNGNTHCKWKTNGGGDPGQLICLDWKIVNCEVDASWDDGAINCHGESYHRGWACNW